MPAGNPAGYLSPEMIAQLTGQSEVSFSPAGQQQMQTSLREQGVFPNDSSPGAELLRRLLEVERTRKLHDARGNAAAAEVTRRGGTGLFSWFLPELKEPGYGGG